MSYNGVKHLKTSGGTAPSPEMLDHGAIAIAYKSGEESLFIKNTDDEIVKICSTQDVALLRETIDSLKTVEISYAYSLAQSALEKADDAYDKAIENSDMIDTLSQRLNDVTGGASDALQSFKEVNDWIKEHEEDYKELTALTTTYATKSEVESIQTKADDNTESIDLLRETINSLKTVEISYAYSLAQSALEKADDNTESIALLQESFTNDISSVLSLINDSNKGNESLYQSILKLNRDIESMKSKIDGTDY